MDTRQKPMLNWRFSIGLIPLTIGAGLLSVHVFNFVWPAQVEFPLSWLMLLHFLGGLFLYGLGLTVMIRAGKSKSRMHSFSLTAGVLVGLIVAFLPRLIKESWICKGMIVFFALFVLGLAICWATREILNRRGSGTA